MIQGAKYTQPGFYPQKKKKSKLNLGQNFYSRLETALTMIKDFTSKTNQKKKIRLVLYSNLSAKKTYATNVPSTSVQLILSEYDK